MTAPAPQPDGPAPIVVGEFEKNNRETVRVTLSTYAGHDIVDVRAFLGTTPTRSGLTIRREQLPALADLLALAVAIEADRLS